MFTPINIHAITDALHLHPVRHFVNRLLDGLQHGFSTGLSCLPASSFICSNLRSATSDPHTVSSVIKAEVFKFWSLVPNTDSFPHPVPSFKDLTFV
ncbi:hypothetical protein EOD39_3802 [Acipenser ruthenus]|uniref:Uncharacterized protein n=1 Tax=Acipenser ruthenus TaxID=7906 RepID=A0A444UL93_ACIRT|nr:hypothetical protein EOD39_3802 [Acipenser ruthenus]